QKHILRRNIAANMINIKREQGDERGVEFWSYVLTVIDVMKHHGMSDEEDETEPVMFGNLRLMDQVRIVQELDWRDSSFSHLFALVDRTPRLETEYFNQTGKKPMKRLRDHPSRKIVKRKPPKGLPRSFFKPEYLRQKEAFPHEIAALGLNKNDFEIRDWNGYDPYRSSEN
ncbi:hypothetical protein K435DRAFT_658109, partial [Dendrothele bispora CBS 962.96]